MVQTKAVKEVEFSENRIYCPKLVQTTKASLSELEVGSGVTIAVEKRCSACFISPSLLSSMCSTLSTCMILKCFETINLEAENVGLLCRACTNHRDFTVPLRNL